MELRDKKRLMFDPEKSFFSLPIVWFTVGITVLFSGLVCFLIVLNDNLAFDLTSKGFNYAIVIFKVPLGILALLIPIVALLAGNHRSEQTAHHMSVLRSQNNFQNYRQHRDDFKQYCADVAGDRFCTIDNPNKYHSDLFPKAKDGDLTPDDQALRILSEFGNELLTLFLHFKSGDPQSYMKQLKTVQLCANAILMYGITLGSREVQNNIKLDNETFRVLGEYASDSITGYRGLFNVFYNSCFFAESPDLDLFAVSELIKQINFAECEDFRYKIIY